MISDDELVVTLIRENHPFLNPAGLKLDLTKSNIENDVNQQFIFGKKEWNTAIDSVAQQGMVWDVADFYNSNPPAGTFFHSMRRSFRTKRNRNLFHFWHL